MKDYTPDPRHGGSHGDAVDPLDGYPVEMFDPTATVLLLPDGVDPRRFAGLFAAVDVVVANDGQLLKRPTPRGGATDAR
jgi:hypothetical protein